MRVSPIREVQHKERIRPGLLMAGLAVFAAAALLRWGTVKTYELRRENDRLETELLEMQDDLSRLRLETAYAPDLYARARSLGLGAAAPEQVVILHLR